MYAPDVKGAEKELGLLHLKVWGGRGLEGFLNGGGEGSNSELFSH